MRVEADIRWDLYDEDQDKTLTPEEAGVPETIQFEIPGKNPDAEVIEYIENHYDWSVLGVNWSSVDG